MAAVERFDAPGLPADWLNGWLAAIGVAVLLPEVKLSWTVDVVPYAVFWLTGQMELPVALAENIPDVEKLDRSAIARNHPDSEFEFTRKLNLSVYRSRAAIERRQGGYLLSSSCSDNLLRSDGSELEHGAFDPPAPRGETLHSRAVKCRKLVEDVREGIAQSLAGHAELVQANGLGFNCRRLSAGVQADGKGSKVYVDPVVELLVLGGLRLFPVRGNGREVRQRCWVGPPSREGGFRWFTWCTPLDVWAIDALLDDPSLADGTTWQSVPYRTSKNDVTRAYFSEPVP